MQPDYLGGELCLHIGLLEHGWRCVGGIHSLEGPQYLRPRPERLTPKYLPLALLFSAQATWSMAKSLTSIMLMLSLGTFSFMLSPQNLSHPGETIACHWTGSICSRIKLGFMMQSRGALARSGSTVLLIPSYSCKEAISIKVLAAGENLPFCCCTSGSLQE